MSSFLDIAQPVEHSLVTVQLISWLRLLDNTHAFFDIKCYTISVLYEYQQESVQINRIMIIHFSKTLMFYYNFSFFIMVYFSSWANYYSSTHQVGSQATQGRLMNWHPEGSQSADTKIPIHLLFSILLPAPVLHSGPIMCWLWSRLWSVSWKMIQGSVLCSPSVCDSRKLTLSDFWLWLRFMPHTPQAALFTAIIDKCVAALLISLSHCYQNHAGTDQKSSKIKLAKEFLNSDGKFDFILGYVLE